MTTEDKSRLKRAVTKYTSRRRFLAGVAVTSTLVGAGSIAYAQQSDTGSYRLEGITSGWVGLEPERIADTTNPTLNLIPGMEYEVTWVASDGNSHNFAIFSSNGEALVRSEIISSGTQTVTFTASEDMVTYLCEVHPNSMAGDISLGSSAGNMTAGGNQTGQNQTEEPVNDSNVSDLPDEPQPTGPLAEDSQKLIAQLEAKEGVETDATGTTYFTFYPEDSSVEANVLFTVYVDGLDNATAAHIHLDRPDDDNPIVAPLYPTDDLVTSEVNQEYAINSTNATNGTNATNATEGETGDQNGTEEMINKTQEIPADALPGTTLADSQLVAEDLTGPFEDADSLLPLVEAMNNGESFVQVHTEDNPGGAILGTIMPAQGMAQNGGGGGHETTDGDGGTETERPSDGDNSKAKTGNGKAKSGNGKAKNGDGKQS